MNDSNSPPPPGTPRPTLKLKGAPRAPVEHVKPAPSPAAPSKSNQKPGAHWSDEYKRRMQADMDELTSK